MERLGRNHTMRQLRFLAALVALMVFPTLARANHYSDFYVIPIAGHTPGVNGTLWMSDVAIQNFQTTPLTVQLVFIQSGENRSDNVLPILGGTMQGSVTVAPGGSTLIKDVLKNFLAQPSVTGAILIGADRPFAVTSRSYSMVPSGDTVGQTVPPARDFIDNTIGRTDLSMAVAYVPGLINNANFRSNLGFVAGNGSATSQMILEVSLRNAAGAMIGTPRRFLIGAGVFTHLQFSSRSIADSSFDIGSATFRIVEGSGAVVPYASVIDNRTADAVFVAGQFPANSTVANKDFSQSLFRTTFDLMKIPE